MGEECQGSTEVNSIFNDAMLEAGFLQDDLLLFRESNIAGA